MTLLFVPHAGPQYNRHHNSPEPYLNRVFLRKGSNSRGGNSRDFSSKPGWADIINPIMVRPVKDMDNPAMWDTGVKWEQLSPFRRGIIKNS